MNYLIRGGRIIDPENGRDQIGDLYLMEGKIAEKPTEDMQVIEAKGKIVVPGLIDLHSHLRDPGFTHKEDVYSGTAAAAAGGFTAVCCMPNTNPTISSPEVVKELIEKGKESKKARVLPIASISEGMNGEKLSNFTELAESGAVAFSDDGKPVLSDGVMRAALISAKARNFTVISHCESPVLTAGGAINEGKVSAELGLGGIPNSAEDIMIARDLVLAAETGAHIHIAHVSTAGGIDMIRTAKGKGVHVTCETCPHYFVLTEEAVKEHGANAKMSPPLRTERDRLAVLAGIADGTVDLIATDHAPHTAEEKEQGLAKAPNGIVGFETAFSLSLTYLVKSGIIPLSRLIELMSTVPAKQIPGGYGTLSIGAPADVTIIDIDAERLINKDRLHSKSHNMPYDGMKVFGKICSTFVGGNLVYENTQD